LIGILKVEWKLRKMENETCFVAFIDILGFRNHIANYFSGKEPEALPLLKKAMSDAQQFAIHYSGKYLSQFEIKFSFRQFSDCVSITMPFTQGNRLDNLIIYGAFINVVRMYQLVLLPNKILVRGGISMGKHYEDPNIIFSEGLVTAYKLESSKAIYPRIIVDKEIVNLVKDHLNRNSGDHDLLYGLFLHSMMEDWDGEIFVSPFGIGGELKLILDKFGEPVLQDLVDLYVAANKLDPTVMNGLVNDLNTTDLDKKMIRYLLINLENFFLANQTEAPEIIIKYKWLREFLTWNLDPEKSKIRFKRVFESVPGITKHV
jgi:hypothetical protein